MEHWATPDPELHLEPQSKFGQCRSLALRFAVGLLVYTTVYVVQVYELLRTNKLFNKKTHIMNGQWLVVTGFYERYIANSIQQFIDLCSVANISVFVMTHENYGFYLHGRY